MRSAAPARTRPNSPMRTHGSGGSLCGYACGRMRGRLDTHLGAGTASADARSEAPDPCRHATLSAVQHSPTRTRNARSTSCCAACSMLLAVACATACGTTQRWPPARADALRGRGKAARRAGGRRSGKRATAARGARGLHDPPNKKLITCIWVGVFETHCCCSAFFTTTTTTTSYPHLLVRATDRAFTWPEAQGPVSTVACMGRGAAGTHASWQMGARAWMGISPAHRITNYRCL